MKDWVRSDGIAEGSMPAGVSKELVASTTVEVLATSDAGGVARGAATGGTGSGDVEGVGLDFQKKPLAPREALKGRRDEQGT